MNRPKMPGLASVRRGQALRMARMVVAHEYAHESRRTRHSSWFGGVLRERSGTPGISAVARSEEVALPKCRGRVDSVLDRVTISRSRTGKVGQRPDARR